MSYYVSLCIFVTLSIHDPIFVTTTNIPYKYIFIQNLFTSAHTHHGINNCVKECDNSIFSRTIINEIQWLNYQR